MFLMNYSITKSQTKCVYCVDIEQKAAMTTLDQPHMTTVSLDQKISEFTKLIQSTLNSIFI